MADQKISQLTALTSANVASGDLLAIVDTDATETKSIAMSEVDARYGRVAPTSFTPTFAAGSCTFTGSTGYYYQNGLWLEGQAFTSVDVAGGSGELTFTVPNSEVIDTTYVLSTAGDSTSDPMGYGKWFDNGSQYRTISPQYETTTTLTFFYDGAAIINASFLANGDNFNFYFRIPIVGGL